jgi:hypothetical protein
MEMSQLTNLGERDGDVALESLEDSDDLRADVDRAGLDHVALEVRHRRRGNKAEHGHEEHGEEGDGLEELHRGSLGERGMKGWMRVFEGECSKVSVRR